jgi:hypothetical protein
MITANVKGKLYRVNGLANRGQWFGRTWLIGIGVGFDCAMIVVEGDNETDIIDTLTDSKYGHLIKTDDICEFCERQDYDNCVCSFAGNWGERVNLDDIRIMERCKVDYFVKQESVR